MDSHRWERIQSIFLDALDQEASERSSFLAAACGDDDGLRGEVESMLRAHLGNGALAIEEWLESETPAEAAPLIDARIGPYRTKGLLGRGGMGEVYLAERADDQYQQDVALKLLGRGLFTADATRRFRAERQILARLIHPNIARLLDGGVTEQGRPYLVMEYVAGAPITEHCDRQCLGIEQRLGLFLSVCDAVGFAHRNLIVHRDVKPSNVLVGRDGDVRLLDFGIAKLLDPEQAGLDDSLTQSGSRVMTAECAAPEQVRGEAITTATDVYALGILLYELLTGHRPYRLPRHRPREAERIICGEEPSRPSTIVTRRVEVEKPDGSTETVTPDRIGSSRSTPPARLRRLLHGDLDNIVLMALRKEPERRYASAHQLAEDIRRYRAGKPVMARADTVMYRFQKFAQRNRGGVAAGVTILMLLLGSTILTSVQGRQVRLQRDVARQETVKAEQVTDFLLGLFDAAAPVSAPRDTLSIREILEKGRARVEELSGQPRIQAETFQVLSHAYWRLGRNDLASDLAERGLEVRRATYGNHDPETANGLYWLGTIRQSQSRLDEARELFTEALAIHRDHFGDGSPQVLKTQFRLGLVLHMSRQTEAADSLLSNWQAALRLGEADEDEELGIALSSLGPYLQFSGRLEEAESVLRRAIEIRTRLYGPEDYRVAEDTNALSGVLVGLGRNHDAETLARQALAIHRAIFPEGHFALARSLDAVGEALMGQEKYADAEPFFLEALDVYRGLYGDEHGFAARGQIMLGQLYHHWKRYEEAERYYRATAELYGRLYGRDYLITIRSRRLLATLLRDRREFAAAEEILRADYQTLLRDRGEHDRDTEVGRQQLVQLYEAWDRPDLAAALRD